MWYVTDNQKMNLISDQFMVALIFKKGMIPHLKADPFPWNIVAEDQLVPTLPLKEKTPSATTGQAGLVVSHEVTAHKVTVVPRVQCGIEEEWVIFRSVNKRERQ